MAIGRIRIKYRTREAAAGYMLILPSLAGFTLFFLAPFVKSFYYCFIGSLGKPDFVGLDNFVELLGSRSFLLASRNTLIFNGISVPLIMIISFLFALLLNGRIRGKPYFRSFFILPLVLPVSSVVLVWQIVFDKYGVLNQMLAKTGIHGTDWMMSGWSVGVLMLLYLWKNCGYNVILFLAGLGSIPHEYYESARIDGAGPFRCLTKITIPFILPAGFFVFVISIINSFKVFREAYLLEGSYPDTHIYLMQHFMNNNFYNMAFQRLSTSAFLMAGVIGLLVFILFVTEDRMGRDIR